MDDVALGNAYCHFVPKAWPIEFVASATSIERNILNRFKISPIHCNFGSSSIVADEPILPADLLYEIGKDKT